MKRNFLTPIALVFLFAVAGAFLSAPAVMAQGTGKAAGPAGAAPPGGTSPEACLKCHGPLDKLTSAQPWYVAPSGEKINPHVYVPHDLKEVPNCVSCHKPHSANPTPAELAALPKPTVKTCFECHHVQNFQNCAKCHKKE